MKINETIEKQVVYYVLKCWLLPAGKTYDRWFDRFGTYLNALQDADIIKKECDELNFMDFLDPYFSGFDVSIVVQKTLEHLREAAKPEEAEND